MKVGDIVKVRDGSYSKALIKGRMEHRNGLQLNGRRFRVHGTDGKYPTDNTYSPLDWSGINDALLVDVNDSDFVLFSQERFCSVVTPAKKIPSPVLEIMVPRGAKELLLRFPSES